MVKSLWSEIKSFAAIYSKHIPYKNSDLFLRELLLRKDVKTRIATEKGRKKKWRNDPGGNSQNDDNPTISH